MYKKLIASILILSLIFYVKGQNYNICEATKVKPLNDFDQCDYNPWVLVFEDNFDGNQLDTNKWELRPWGYGSFGDSQEYDTLDNAVVSDGTLKIIAQRDTINRKAIFWLEDDIILEDNLPNLRTFYYTSSNIWSKYAFKYGKFEARIKIPKGRGLWPAFWTFSAHPWNEIDIFEFYIDPSNPIFDPTVISSRHRINVHYDYDGDGESNNCGSTNVGNDFSQDFHVFSVVWEKNIIEWYVDDVLIRTDHRYLDLLGHAAGCNIYATQAYFKNLIFPVNPMNIIVNLAIQSKNCAPDNSTVFPSQMEIDWIKYYQRNPCQNIAITDYNQYPLDSILYNTIVGVNIETDCEYEVSNKYMLNMVARDQIVLGSGFHATTGSLFSAKIDSTLWQIASKDYESPKDCNNNNTIDMSSFETKDICPDNISYIEHKDSDKYNSEYDESIITDNNSEDASSMIFFPNPNNGLFTIHISDLNCNYYSIVITDICGRCVLSDNNLTSTQLTIDLRKNGKGIYLVQIYDENCLNIKRQKIIVK